MNVSASVKRASDPLGKIYSVGFDRHSLDFLKQNSEIEVAKASLLKGDTYFYLFPCGS